LKIDVVIFMEKNDEKLRNSIVSFSSSKFETNLLKKKLEN